MITHNTTGKMAVLTLLLGTCCGPATAAEEAENTMVVTASGFSQDLRDAPASITVISREQLEKHPVHDLADAVKDITGVSVIGSSANTRDISLRGLPGEYTLIMVDGKRQNSRESRPNGSGGFEAGFIPPVEAIERIEVIRGPMSSLYGSDAMGGVINIITRKVASDWTGALSMDGTLQENSDAGNSMAGNFYLSGPLIENTLGLQLYGSGNFRQEDRILGGYNENDNKSLTAKLTWKPVDNQEITLEGGREIQTREQTPGKSIAAYSQRGSLLQPNTRSQINNIRNHWALGHTGYWDFGTSTLNVYQEQTERAVRSFNLNENTGRWTGDYDDRRPEITNTVVDASLTLPLPDNMLTMGGQYQYARLQDDSSTGRNQSEVATVSSYQRALFIEDEYAITDDLAFTGGLRLDNHEQYGNHWNPRGYLVYHLTDNITLKSGIAKAFRAPELRQLSPEYGTATQGGAGIIYGNTDLKPETSLSEEIGIAYDHESGFSSSLTLFNTDFKNKLTSYGTGEIDPITGLNLFTYDNVGKANIKGVEASSTVPLTGGWKLDLNYTYLDSKRKSDDERFSSGESLKGQPLTMTPKHNANARLAWQVSQDIDAYTRFNYIGRQIWADQRNSYTGPRYRSGYTTVDVGGSWQFNKNTRFNMAVLNITDETADDINTQGGNWAVEDGRRYWAGVNIKF